MEASNRDFNRRHIGKNRLENFDSMSLQYCGTEFVTDPARAYKRITTCMRRGIKVWAFRVVGMNRLKRLRNSELGI